LAKITLRGLVVSFDIFALFDDFLAVLGDVKVLMLVEMA
jgi:hypothetical protein